MNEDRPILSVVVPVHQRGDVLARCLDALAASDLPREQWELVVVSDASSDDSVSIAARHADTIVRLDGSPRGAAYARNRGFEVARATLVAFVSSDVCVFPDTLGRLVAALSDDDSVGAVCATYDADTAPRGLVTQYRALHRSFGYGDVAGDVNGFLGGCGAVRRSVFEAAGMYNEWWVNRPRVEAADMGQRVRWQRRRIVHDPAIRATHLKPWTLRTLLADELRDSGIPWGEEPPRTTPHARPRLTRLRALERRSLDLLWLGLVCAFGALLPSVLLTRQVMWGAAALCFLAFLFLSRRMYAYFLRIRGPQFLVVAVPVHVLASLASGMARALVWLRRHTIGEPLPDPTTEALAEVGLGVWPPVPRKKRLSRPLVPVRG